MLEPRKAGYSRNYQKRGDGRRQRGKVGCRHLRVKENVECAPDIGHDARGVPPKIYRQPIELKYRVGEAEGCFPAYESNRRPQQNQTGATESHQGFPLSGNEECKQQRQNEMRLESGKCQKTTGKDLVTLGKLAENQGKQ